MTIRPALLRPAGLLAVTTLATSAAVALAIWAIGAGARARELLDLSFVAPDAHVPVAIDTAATNLRLAAAVLVAAYARSRWPRVGLVLDLPMALLLAVNCLVLGAAAGGYGPRLFEALALHGPLELAGFALAGGAYLAARTHQRALSDLGAAAAGTTVLLLAAAWIETYVSVGATR